MAHPPLPSLDDLTNREWVKLTDGKENMISFCQLVGLLPVTLAQPYPKGHTDWYLGVNKKVIDECA